MVIGQTGPLEYLILCSEGPESQDFPNQGFSLPQMAKLCVAFGMTNAYNMDGGSSANVSLGGIKINSLSNPKRRAIGDIIYFATLVPNK
jgi:exopolysaccharide biosynthesis protein